MLRCVALALTVASTLGVLAAPRAYAQDAPVEERRVPAEEQRVVLVDGQVLVGVVIEDTEAYLLLRTRDGVETRVPRARVREVGPLLDGGFTRHDPVPSRLFVAPTGRTMPGGSGRISAFYVFPSIAYSPTDRLDLSLASTIPTLGLTVLNLNVKGQVLRSEQVAVSVGGNAVFPVGDSVDDGGVGGSLYAVLTAGSRVQAFTVGVFGVYGGDFDEVEFGQGFGVLAAYERQVSNSVKLMTENLIGVGSSDVAGLSLAGVRFFGDRLVGDLAAALAWSADGLELLPIPYVGFSYTFGR